MGFALEQTVGNYEFLDALETSKGSRTYKVRNLLTQRIEKLKVFPKEMQRDRERSERFLREIKIHASLSHPNIAAFYDASYLDGQLVMTTELVEGSPLTQLLAAGPIGPRDAVHYARQVLAALTHAHEHGVIHRMISPAIAIITPEKSVKLTGFELAKTLTDPQLTQAGVIMGELEYMSPEQVKGVSALDARSDIYSAGAVLYEMVAGKPPFQSNSQFELMMAHVQKQPNPPSQIRPDVPPALEKIILTALAKDPAGRFQTAKEFQDALEKLEGSLGAAETSPRTLPPLVRRQVPGAPQASDFSAALVTKDPPLFSRDLIVAGVFIFFVVAAVFFAFLTATKR
jgi:serine/threonine-protein kinase